MMHQFSREITVVSMNNEFLAENLVFKERFRNISIYSTNDLGKIKKCIENQRCIQYLNNFLIVLPVKYELQSVLWNDFYSYYGDLYEDMIDVKNNVECIKELYSYIGRNVKIDCMTNILDYGCGSGLSVYIDTECQLIGYEPNEKMRRQAAKRGMDVIDYKQLCSMKCNCIDAIFSCYVFHMGINSKDIRLMKKIIRQEGLIIANFYKNINYKIVNAEFIKNGFEVKKILEFDERFGYIYEYRKK